MNRFAKRQFLPATRPAPLISILHSCSDPISGWHDAFRSFTSLASSPLSIEYILIVDHSHHKNLGMFGQIFRLHDGDIDTSSVVGRFKMLLNRGPSTDESRFQVGMKHASPETIKVLIVDEMRPPSISWDQILVLQHIKEPVNA